MSAYGCLTNIATDMRADLGDGPCIELARQQFDRICERDGVTRNEEPTVEWALIPEHEWEDPETGEIILVPESWALRLLADAS